MALKTVWRALAFLFLALAPLPPLNSQTSPLDWPPPPAFPPLPRPAVLMDGGELAAALANGTAVPFDVRSGAAYAAGHLPGAVPAWSPEEEGPVTHEGLGQVRALLAGRGLSGAETIVLYGDDGDPDREAVGRLFWLLRSAGCASVRVLDGGLAAWRRAGRDLATGPSRWSAAELNRAPDHQVTEATEVTVDAAWVETSYGEAGVEILDLRDARGWDRWETPPLFAAGHIPYSLPWDARALLPKAGGWPRPDEVRRRIAKLGPRPGDPVLPNATFVLYGDDARDPRLGLGYLTLSLAGFDVRVFAGGWAGWTEGGQRPQRPVIRVLSAREVAALLAQENPGLSGDHPPRGLILFDLREAADFAIGHLPGARSLPDRQFPTSFEKSVQEGWPDADRAAIPLLLYCYGVECVRSRKAGAAAAHAGFRHVLWFRGGIQEWREAGYPLPESPVTAPGRPGSPAGSAARP
jgi:thiosulfate/3-mercaptopyruvate sulfurtransferase